MGRYVSLRNRVLAVGLTDTGKVREHNEDSISLDGDIGLVRPRRRHGRLQRRRSRERHRGQDDHEPRARGRTSRRNSTAATSRPACTGPASSCATPSHAPTRSSTRPSKSQTQCEGMGTTVVAAPVLRQPDHDRARRRFADVPAAEGHVRAADAWTIRCSRSSWTAVSTPREEAQRATNKNYVTRALGVERNRRSRGPRTAD